MFWPRNHVRYENLKSSFVNLENLLEDLDTESFEGFLEIVFGEEFYYLLRRPGLKGGIYLKDKMGRFIPAEISLTEIQARCHQENAIINVYDVNREQLEFLSECLNSTPLYTNLSSEFTDFEKLLSKLSKDTHTGYLEVSFQDVPTEPCYIFYQQGEIGGILWGDHQYEDAEKGIQEISTKLRENEAQFNVYQIERVSVTEREEAPEIDLNHERETAAEPRIPEPEEPVSEPEFKTPEKQPEVTEEKTVTYEENEAAVSPVENEIPGQAETPRADAEDKNKLENLSIFPYLDFAEALIQWVEENVNKVMGKNYFSKAFKKGLLNISDKYPFLDPFLAEFTYMDGKITFTSEATAIEFLKGIYAAIESLLEELTVKERENIQKRLKQSLRRLEKIHHENIEILRVRTLMPTLFQ